MDDAEHDQRGHPACRRQPAHRLRPSRRLSFKALAGSRPRGSHRNKRPDQVRRLRIFPDSHRRICPTGCRWCLAINKHSGSAHSALKLHVPARARTAASPPARSRVIRPLTRAPGDALEFRSPNPRWVMSTLAARPSERLPPFEHSPLDQVEVFTRAVSRIQHDLWLRKRNIVLAAQHDMGPNRVHTTQGSRAVAPRRTRAMDLHVRAHTLHHAESSAVALSQPLPLDSRLLPSDQVQHARRTSAQLLLCNPESSVQPMRRWPSTGNSTFDQTSGNARSPDMTRIEAHNRRTDFRCDQIRNRRLARSCPSRDDNEPRLTAHRVVPTPELLSPQT